MFGLNTFDLLIILLALLAIGRGIQLGFFRQVLSLIGFFVGLFLGSAVMPFIAALLSDSQSGRAVLVLLLTFGLAILLAGIGESYGRRIQIKITHKPTIVAETAFGILLSVVSTIILTWLMGSILLRLPTANIAASISESKIMQALDERLPPAPSVMSRIGRLLSPEGFPRVFTGIEPFSPDAGMAYEPDVLAAAEHAAASTVRIEGIGCGGAMFGSGFVIEDGFIATNAHVIAGIKNPIVADQDGRYRATPVWFDANLDFALLKVDEHAGDPLALASEEISRSTTVATLGYPGGGDFSVHPTVVLNRHTAIGRNIYDTGLVNRDVYELQADIRQGNSGGPVVLPDGRVIGIIFGKSAAREARGFALTSIQIIDTLEQASVDEPVSTGRCVNA